MRDIALVAHYTKMLLSPHFKETTATKLWEEGLDYGEDESLGHKLEEYVDPDEASWPKGAWSVIRLSWYDPEDKATHFVLHVHYINDETPAPDVVGRHLELKFYDV